RCSLAVPRLGLAPREGDGLMFGSAMTYQPRTIRTNRRFARGRWMMLAVLAVGSTLLVFASPRDAASAGLPASTFSGVLRDQAGSVLAGQGVLVEKAGGQNASGTTTADGSFSLSATPDLYTDMEVGGSFSSAGAAGPSPNDHWFAYVRDFDLQHSIA